MARGRGPRLAFRHGVIAASIEIARPSLNVFGPFAGVPLSPLIAPGNVAAFPTLIEALFSADPLPIEPLPTNPQATHASIAKKDYLQSSNDTPKKKSLPAAIFTSVSIDATVISHEQTSPAPLSQPAAPAMKVPNRLAADSTELSAQVSSMNAASETVSRQPSGPIAFTLCLTTMQDNIVREVTEAQPAQTPQAPTQKAFLAAQTAQPPAQPVPIEQAAIQQAPTQPASTQQRPTQTAATPHAPTPGPAQQAPKQQESLSDQAPQQTLKLKSVSAPQQPQRPEAPRTVVAPPSSNETPAPAADRQQIPLGQAPAEYVAPTPRPPVTKQDQPAAPQQIAGPAEKPAPTNDSGASTRAPKVERHVPQQQSANEQQNMRDAKPQPGRKDAPPQTDTKQTKAAVMNPQPIACAESSAVALVRKDAPGSNSTPAKAAQPHTTMAAVENPKYSFVSLQPARQISLQLKGENSARVDVQLTDRAGRIAVAVRTADHELARSLQTDLGDLVGQLENKGFKTEAWAPSAARTSEAASLTFAKSDSGQGHSGGAGSGKNPDQQNQNGSNPRQQPRWMAERKKAFDKTGENKQ